MKKNYICLSYIPANGLKEETAAKIDFKKITHINIAFSLIEKNENGFYVPVISPGVRNGISVLQNEISRQGAESKLLISIGGYGASYFCEACSNDENRKSFARECASLLKNISLDGIDLDWEFPGRGNGGISFCKNCCADYIKLCEEIRLAIGNSLFTSAVGSTFFKDMDYSRLNELFDFVNVMTYDMSNHAHSSFFRTTNCMRLWNKFAFDREKLVLGVPFYARCKNEEYEWRGYSDLMELVKNGKAELRRGSNQDFVVIEGNKLGIDTPQSILKKVKWVQENGFAGIFNWQETTDRNGELRNAMAKIND